MDKFFSASMGVSVKLITVAASAILLGIPVSAVASGMRSGFSVLLVLPAMIWVTALLFKISGYTLTPDALHINRYWWKSVISLAALQHAEYKPRAMARSLRLFGNGGLFVVAGLFRKREFGIYRAFVSNQENTVVLYFSDRTIVVSPDRPEDFTTALNQRQPEGNV